ncbi:N-acetylornithine carbamoyltransferase [Aquimarina brevivitae]|uniref:N-succinylornithine carbamoyltransferase n=1 Tax=Aquimarina brevivitae TaxID=323412 RepID=A0A4Q7NYV3_9FLAO|nr:N-acetylornithine carbamoyltransferase [Aquimarina brevivitae]RZS92474.1 ornithine carbamoyltransferase [Aquimarina brevivitae]
MKHFFSVEDIDNSEQWIAEAMQLKKSPLAHKTLGTHKTLGMLFFNPSLRTRLSTQKAALNLGMEIMIMNFSGEGWTLEFEDGIIMDQGSSEHIKEAAQVVSQYCDVLAIRSFAELKDREEDYKEKVLQGFMKYATIPVINMESATGHPLQALTDALTIVEHKTETRPRVVLTWAPHPKALPQAVANSFVAMMQKLDVDFAVTHPKGFELANQIIKDTPVFYDQDKALDQADFVYVKNWSAYQDYGKTSLDFDWTLTKEKMKITNEAFLMHCLPVRRNVVIADAVLDSQQSLVIKQALNRVYAAQLVLKKLLDKK